MSHLSYEEAVDALPFVTAEDDLLALAAPQVGAQSKGLSIGFSHDGASRDDIADAASLSAESTVLLASLHGINEVRDPSNPSQMFSADVMRKAKQNVATLILNPEQAGALKFSTVDLPDVPVGPAMVSAARQGLIASKVQAQELLKDLRQFVRPLTVSHTHPDRIGFNWHARIPGTAGMSMPGAALTRGAWAGFFADLDFGTIGHSEIVPTKGDRNGGHMVEEDAALNMINSCIIAVVNALAVQIIGALLQCARETEAALIEARCPPDTEASFNDLCKEAARYFAMVDAANRGDVSIIGIQEALSEAFSTFKWNADAGATATLLMSTPSALATRVAGVGSAGIKVQDSAYKSGSALASMEGLVKAVPQNWSGPAPVIVGKIGRNRDPLRSTAAVATFFYTGTPANAAHHNGRPKEFPGIAPGGDGEAWTTSRVIREVSGMFDPKTGLLERPPFDLSSPVPVPVQAMRGTPHGVRLGDGKVGIAHYLGSLAPGRWGDEDALPAAIHAIMCMVKEQDPKAFEMFEQSVRLMRSSLDSRVASEIIQEASKTALGNQRYMVYSISSTLLTSLADGDAEARADNEALIDTLSSIVGVVNAIAKVVRKVMPTSVMQNFVMASPSVHYQRTLGLVTSSTVLEAAIWDMIFPTFPVSIDTNATADSGGGREDVFDDLITRVGTDLPSDAAGGSGPAATVLFDIRTSSDASGAGSASEGLLVSSSNAVYSTRIKEGLDDEFGAAQEGVIAQMDKWGVDLPTSMGLDRVVTALAGVEANRAPSSGRPKKKVDSAAMAAQISGNAPMDEAIQAHRDAILEKFFEPEAQVAQGETGAPSFRQQGGYGVNQELDSDRVIFLTLPQLLTLVRQKVGGVRVYGLWAEDARAGRTRRADDVDGRWVDLFEAAVPIFNAEGFMTRGSSVVAAAAWTSGVASMAGPFPPAPYTTVGGGGWTNETFTDAYNLDSRDGVYYLDEDPNPMGFEPPTFKDARGQFIDVEYRDSAVSRYAHSLFNNPDSCEWKRAAMRDDPKSVLAHICADLLAGCKITRHQLVLLADAGVPLHVRGIAVFHPVYTGSAIILGPTKAHAGVTQAEGPFYTHRGIDEATRREIAVVQCDAATAVHRDQTTGAATIVGSVAANLGAQVGGLSTGPDDYFTPSAPMQHDNTEQRLRALSLVSAGENLMHLPLTLQPMMPGLRGPVIAKGIFTTAAVHLSACFDMGGIHLRDEGQSALYPRRTFASRATVTYSSNGKSYVYSGATGGVVYRPDGSRVRRDGAGSGMAPQFDNALEVHGAVNYASGLLWAGNSNALARALSIGSKPSASTAGGMGGGRRRGVWF